MLTEGPISPAEAMPMARQPEITRLEIHQFAWEVSGRETEDNGFNAVYQPGCRGRQTGYVLRIETDQGLAGEYVGGQAASYAQVGMAANYLLGRNPLERELIYNDLKRVFRKLDRLGIGPTDCALWDLAGKVQSCRCTLPGDKPGAASGVPFRVTITL
jgi:L-alanine-DL-glutamate epimerase-like enolase superfamily enzyme